MCSNFQQVRKFYLNRNLSKFIIQRLLFDSFSVRIETKQCFRLFKIIYVILNRHAFK